MSRYAFPNRQAVEREIESAENPQGMRLNDGKERVRLPGGTLRYMLAVMDKLNAEKEAAYAAGQRAEREACAIVCDDIETEHWKAYKGRAEKVDRDQLYNPHTEGISDGAGQCADAIRNRKEQG